MGIALDIDTGLVMEVASLMEAVAVQVAGKQAGMSTPGVLAAEVNTIAGVSSTPDPQKKCTSVYTSTFSDAEIVLG